MVFWGPPFRASRGQQVFQQPIVLGFGVFPKWAVTGLLVVTSHFNAPAVDRTFCFPPPGHFPLVRFGMIVVVVVFFWGGVLPAVPDQKKMPGRPS